VIARCLGACDVATAFAFARSHALEVAVRSGGHNPAGHCNAGGVVGSTGVAGLTLGGGIGHLTAQHGLTCDNLVGAELVTPDGTVVRASDGDMGGSVSEALRLFRDLIAGAPREVNDGLGRHSFVAHVFSPPYGVDRNYWKGHFVRELPNELLDELLRRLA
jgi:hypothetical protein